MNSTLSLLGLERIFNNPDHEYHNILFYDYRAGSYYDRSIDIYVSIDELRRYGIGNVAKNKHSD